MSRRGRLSLFPLLLLAGCGIQFAERVESDGWAPSGGADQACCTVEGALEALARHRRFRDQVWAPPLIAAGPGHDSSAWLSVDVVMRVQGVLAVVDAESGDVLYAFPRTARLREAYGSRAFRTAYDAMGVLRPQNPFTLDADLVRLV